MIRKEKIYTYIHYIYCFRPVTSKTLMLLADIYLYIYIWNISSLVFCLTSENLDAFCMVFRLFLLNIFFVLIDDVFVLSSRINTYTYLCVWLFFKLFMLLFLYTDMSFHIMRISNEKINNTKCVI